MQRLIFEVCWVDLAGSNQAGSWDTAGRCRGLAAD
jgi:hypothetical protein